MDIPVCKLDGVREHSEGYPVDLVWDGSYQRSQPSPHFLGVISIYYGMTEELTTMLSVNTKLGPSPSSSRFFMRCSTDKSKLSIRSVQVKLPSQK